jgi:TetR/AcrR family transcriptional repressor of nem operon
LRRQPEALARRASGGPQPLRPARFNQRFRRCLRQYPHLFRRSLEKGNRLSLCSFMSAEYDDLPDAVKKEVQAFANVNVA